MGATVEHQRRPDFYVESRLRSRSTAASRATLTGRSPSDPTRHHAELRLPVNRDRVLYCSPYAVATAMQFDAGLTSMPALFRFTQFLYEVLREQLAAHDRSHKDEEDEGHNRMLKPTAGGNLACDTWAASVKIDGLAMSRD
jgi:hypothetical protein